ncbi:hypothetical protein PINS_up006042 [Pythium insidiosum]|nr:hypothetical protein PINS_up006042 [Pythium insidiosum]
MMQDAEMSTHEMEWRLRNAAWRGDIATVNALLRMDPDVNARDPLMNGWTALHRAISRGHSDVVQLLIDEGADLNARDDMGETPLHQALTKGYVDIVLALIRAGVNVKDSSKWGWIPLHTAALKGHVSVVSALIDAGADVAVRAHGGSTALHEACSYGHDDIVELLIDSGADVNASNHSGDTPLHIAARNNRGSIVTVLLDAGADATMLNNQRETPMPYLASSGLFMALWRVLDKGAKMDSRTEEELIRSRGPHALDSLLTCIDLWRKDVEEGKQPTEIPREVFEGGPESIKIYVKEVGESAEVYHRHKICVIGPSMWGKTSLVKSLTQSKCVLEQSSTRTVGIDLFPWRFERTRPDGVMERHEVTFWDLAGQDVYHNVHRVFFSPRTLFLMVIDLKAYADALSSDGMRGSSVDDRMTRFFDNFITPWLSMVYTRLPDAHVVFVGTKRDLVTSVEDIRWDLEGRIAKWLKQRRDRAIEERCGRIDYKRVSDRLTRALKGWISATSNDIGSVIATSDALRGVVLEQGQGFLMPEKYSKVLNRVCDWRSRKWLSLGDPVTKQFMDKAQACKVIQHLCYPLSLPDATCSVIMHTLGELGDVLWYADDHPAAALRNQMCFAPSVVIDFIREIICHELLSIDQPSLVPDNDGNSDSESVEIIQMRREAYDTIRLDLEFDKWTRRLHDAGQVDARLLKMLPLWKELANVRDGEPFVALKQLLQHLGLAYPVGPNEITAESDLIIPAYWQMNEDNKNKPSDRNDNQVEQTMAPANHSWGYQFEIYAPSVPKILFEQIAVRSWSPVYTRVVPSPKQVVDTSPSGDQVEITLTESSIKTVIRVTAVAATPDFAQERAFHHYEVVASVLTEYPGLDVSVSSIDAEGYEEELDSESDDDGGVGGSREAVVMNVSHASDHRVKLSRQWLYLVRLRIGHVVRALVEQAVDDDEVDRAEWLARCFDYDMCIALQAMFEVGETIDSLFEGVTVVHATQKASIEACWDCWLDDKRKCRDLTVIPPSVFANGAPAIRQYARELAALTGGSMHA